MDNLPNDVDELMRLVREARAATVAANARADAAEEALRIAEQAAQQAAAANRSAADANFPWCGSDVPARHAAFAYYVPFMRLNCKQQARAIINITYAF